jgi:hypothetical protein
MADSKAMTHTAFTLRREGKRHGRWLEIGTGRRNEQTGVIEGFLDRLPIGGWNGYVYYAPIGTRPPDPEPERPAQPPDDEDEHL